jgi:dipeptidyl aminopeptidase/acylaminoacyl peptidase
MSLRAACLLTLAPILGFAQAPPLTVDLLAQGPALYGTVPTALRWSLDGQRLYFQWKPASEPWHAEAATWVVERKGTGLRKLTPGEALEAPPLRGSATPDGRWMVAEKEGDLWLWSREQLQPRRLTRTLEAERRPALSRDGRTVTFQRGDNAFALSLTDGTLTQLTDLRDKSPEPEKGTESQVFLKTQERELLETVRLRAERRERQEAEAKALEPRRPAVLPPGFKVADLATAPGAPWILARLRKEDPKAKSALVPAYVTESAFTEAPPARTHVGDRQPAQKLAWVSLATGALEELKTGLPEGTTFQEVQWNPAGTLGATWALAADFKKAWLLRLEPGKAEAAVVLTKEDPAWVAPLAPAPFTLGWTDDATLYFLWERTGWSHLTTVPAAGGEPKALTQGPWEVQEVRLSRDRRSFLLTANRGDLRQKHAFRLPVSGGELVALTTEVGFHEVEADPDGTVLADVASTATRPPELFLKAGSAAPLRITHSPAPAFEALALQAPTYVSFPASDGAQVPARLYRPATWKPGGPAVCFIHGAGYLQNAHKGWSVYGREFLFHQLLLAKGYLVLDLDYRASAGYGRDWRAAIAGHMGGRDLQDVVEGAQWLVAAQGADPKRLGIYGGSYGGFMTLMALFTAPDVFQAGAALRPVTDWAHYNHGYTATILGTPQAHPEAYRKSSPLHHAAGLKGKLLICHGLVDVNVHAQDSIRLAQKLMELRKEDWELALYPVEDHGFIEPASWADEYKRILKLFETTLR